MKPAAEVRPGFLDGVRAFRRGLLLLREPSIRPWAMGPVALAAVVFILAVSFGINVIDASLAPLLSTQWDFLRWLLWPVLGLAMLFAVSIGMVVVSGLLAAPLTGKLSNAVARHLAPGSSLPVAGPWWPTVRRDLACELHKLRYFGLLTLVLLLGLLVPLVNLTSVAWWFAGGAWMLALEFLDGAFGHFGRPFPAALEVLRQHRRMAFGFGGAVALWSLIPVLNCLAMPAAVAGAMVLYHEHFRRDAR